MIDPPGLLHVQGALLWLLSTLLLYAVSSALYRRLDRAPIANPTLLMIAALVLLPAYAGVRVSPPLISRNPDRADLSKEHGG